MGKLVREEMSTRVISPKILYFGTPVVLLTILNLDGSSNITPLSSVWALGGSLVLGLADGGHGLSNLRWHKECVVNIPSSDLWEDVEALAPLTGANPVPEYKQTRFRYEGDKFSAAGLSGIASHQVRPWRIAECPIQIEGRAMAMHSGGGNTHFTVVEVEALVVHAHQSIVKDQYHIDPSAWHPLIYNFRHYFGLGDELGKTFRAETS